ncbi:MAG: hypothetical protein KDD62_16220, partial [Bdellovibrionales bacterium]|nr:hypothetical protein [Bdellovibrionales bacterium]
GFFPDKLGNLSGEQFSPNTALGITNLERSYSDGSNKVKLSLTGGSAGGGAFGGLAGIGRMAAMFQGQTPGQETFRIDGRTANLNTQNETRPELTVFMENGSIISLKTMNGAVKPDELKTMAEGLKLEQLDSYLKG